MEITVVIPTYRPQGYLRECLDSLACQTFPKDRFEVLVVLNGCDSPYREEIEEYISGAGSGLDIRLIHTEQAGVSRARNMALDLAKGRYMCFIDDDDFVSPAYLEELYAKASEDTVVLAYPKAFHDGDPTTVPYRTEEMFIRLSVNGRQSVTKARNLLHITCMRLIPRTVIGDRRFDTSFSVGEDTLMMFLISDRIANVDFTSDRAVYYRRFRKDGAVSSFNASGFTFRLRNSLRLMAKYTGIFLSGIGRYPFFFYLTRLWGAIHSIVRI